MTPAWVLDVFAALMLVVAAVSAARLTAAQPWWGGRGAARADIDAAHLLMAIAMAGTLAGSLRTLPDGAWEAVFGVLVAWFAYRVARDAQVSGFRALAGGHCAPHLIHAGSMLYMFLALTAPAARGSGGMGGGSMGILEYPALAFVFTLLLVGYSIWDLDQLSGPGASPHYSLAVPRLVPAAVLAGVGSGVPAGAGSGPAPAGSSDGDDRTSGRSLSSGRTDRGASGAPADGQGRGVLAPWVAISCRIVMGVTMAFMLVIMI